MKNKQEDLFILKSMFYYFITWDVVFNKYAGDSITGMCHVN